MRHRLPRSTVSFLLFVPFVLGSLAVVGSAYGQSAATAVQPIALSAFGTATGTWTDLAAGRNIGITAGGDVSFLTFRHVRPVLELRGTYPVRDGQVDAQKDVLVGLRLERQVFGAFHPYVNLLAGRGAIDYQRSGYEFNDFIFLRTVSTVYSPGLGVDYDVTPHWSAKVDFQYQHWDTEAVSSGVINPRVLSLGAVYHFDLNHRYKSR